MPSNTTLTAVSPAACRRGKASGPRTRGPWSAASRALSSECRVLTHHPPLCSQRSTLLTPLSQLKVPLGLTSALGVLGTTLLKGKGRVSSLGVCRKGGTTDRACRIRQVLGVPGWTDPSEVTACAVSSPTLWPLCSFIHLQVTESPRDLLFM